MGSLIQGLWGLLSAEQWVGAVLGAAVSAIFAATFTAVRAVLRLRPLRRVLGKLADNDMATAIYVREMFVRQGALWSKEPQYLPTAPTTIHLAGPYPNIPSVMGQADVVAASEVAALLGEAGKRAEIVFRTIEEDWDTWDEPLVTIGGHFKTFRVLEIATPRLITYSLAAVDRFTVAGSNQQFVNDGNTEYGVIVKAIHPTTKAPCLVIMGLGALGTECASLFFRRNARTFAKMFGSGPFAVVVRVALQHGRQTGVPVWIGPSPARWRRVVHPFTYLARVRHWMPRAA